MLTHETVETPTVSATVSTERRIDTPLLWAAGGYALLVTAFLWPVPLSPQRRIYGYGGDGFGFIYDVASGAATPLSFWRSRNVSDLAFPDGYVTSQWIRVQATTTDLVSWPVSRLFGAVASYNLLIFVGLFLTALCTFLLVRTVAGSAPVAFWSGIAFTMFPFVQLAAGAWPSFTHMYWLPLAVLVAIRVRDEPTSRNAVLVPLPVVGAALTNGYVALFTLVVSLAVVPLWFGAARTVVGRWDAATRRRAARRAGVAAAVIVALGAVALSVLGGALRRDEGELVTYGLRLGELVRPNYLQRFSDEWIVPVAPASFHGSNVVEVSQFVGWSTLLLAAVGVVAGWRRTGRDRAVVVVALVGIGLAVVMGMSQTAWFGVASPARLLHGIAPFFRVYSRFGVVVHLFAVLLASLGLSRLVSGLRAGPRGAAVAGVCALTFVELWAPYPGRTTELRRPEFSRHVDATSAPVIAMYPLVRSDDAYFYDQLIWSLYLPASARYVNGGPTDGEMEGLHDEVRSLDNPGTWDTLRAMGVNTVVIDKQNYAARYGSNPTRAEGELVYEDERFAVRRIDPTVEPYAWLEGEMTPAEVRLDGPSWRWIGDDVDLVVRSPRATCVLVSGQVAAPDGDTAFSVTDPATGRAVDVTSDDGTFAVHVPVEQGDNELAIDPHRALARLSATDPRLGTLYMSDVAVAATADGCGP